MKFCPYCGASLLGGAASFCPECGRQVPQQEPDRAARPQPDKKKRPADRPPIMRRGKRPRQELQRPPRRKKNPMDINYDGYYDDVEPIDAGQQGERMDPEMLKKTALMLVGALGVILLAIVFMTVL